MTNLLRAGAIALGLISCAAAAAPIVPQCTFADGTNLPCPSAQETVTLATANSAAGTQRVYGGNYIFAQICSGYGTASLQVLGPDGSTYETVTSKTSPDTTGGTAVQLQGGANVKVVLSGTTACNATLSRVP